MLAHSFRCLSYDRPTVCSKASSSQMRSSASSFNLQNSLFTLRSYYSCLHFLPRLPVFYLSFHNMVLKELLTLPNPVPDPPPSVYCTWDVSPLLDSLLQFFIFQLIGPNNLFHPSPAPHFENFPGISDLLYEVPNFEHHTTLCSKKKVILYSFSLKFEFQFSSENGLLLLENAHLQ